MIGAILGIIGAGMSLYGSLKGKEAAEEQGEAAAAEKQRVAEYNSKISLKDAGTMLAAAREEEFKYGMQLIQTTNKQLELMGAIDVAYAKSGVSVGTGSSLDASMEAARNAAINTELIEYNGRKAAAYRRSQAESYRLSAEYGIRDAAIAASNILETAKNEGNALLIQGLGKAASSIYTMGSDYGWFSGLA